MVDGEKFFKFIDKITEQSPCPTCGNSMFKDQSFCTACGNANETFDAKYHLETLGETVEEVVKNECIEGEHGAQLADSKNIDEIGNAAEYYKEHPYCPDCGKRVGLPE